MKNKALLFLAVLILPIFFASAVYAQQGASQVFVDQIKTLDEAGRLPPKTWEYSKPADYQKEFAMINHYAWDSFKGQVKNFIVSATVTWESSTIYPEWDSAGCGFIFRENNGDHLRLSLYASGLAKIRGLKNGKDLSYSAERFDQYAANGTKEVTLSVIGDKLTLMVGGKIVMKRFGMALTNPGSLGFVTESGSNKDFGTRCIFENVEMYELK